MSAIFLCHSSRDKSFVRLLKQRLDSLRVRVWLDEDEIRAGDSLFDRIATAIEEMEYMGIVLSPNAVSSHWVKEELEIALRDQIEAASVKVIPILLRQCEIPAFLKAKKYLDCTDWKKGSHIGEDSLDKAVDELLRVLGYDPHERRRWCGENLINVKLFRERIVQYFSPHKTTVDIFEDESGLNFIRVDKDDETFDLYEYWSKPTHFEILNKIFRQKDEPEIVGIELIEALPWTPRERDKIVEEICKRHSLNREVFWGRDATFEQATKEEKQLQKRAYAEYEDWLLDQTPVLLIRETIKKKQSTVE